MLYDEYILLKKKRMRSLFFWSIVGKLVFLKVGYWKKNCRFLVCNLVWWKFLNEYFNISFMFLVFVVNFVSVIFFVFFVFIVKFD